eukprot:scaffold4097_cov306-Pinguiococcus_pyrenoidosus.AAC.18
MRFLGPAPDVAQESQKMSVEDLVRSMRAVPPSPELAASLRTSVGALRRFLERYKEDTRGAVMDICSEREAHAIRRQHVVGAVEKLEEAMKTRDAGVVKDLRQVTALYLRLRHDAKVFSASARDERIEARRRVREANRGIQEVRKQMEQESLKAREAGVRRYASWPRSAQSWAAAHPIVSQNPKTAGGGLSLRERPFRREHRTGSRAGDVQAIPWPAPQQDVKPQQGVPFAEEADPKTGEAPGEAHPKAPGGTR